MNGARSDNPVPTISVMLPVYNGEPYLRAAVDSILSQTFVDFELLALDDGSTDRSLAILREYEAKDSRVRVLSRENRGVVQTVNELIATARGRYLARMDHDDICLPERFEKQVKFLDLHSDHVLIGGWAEQINAATQPIGIIRTPLSHQEIDSLNLKGRASIWHPTAMFRRTAVINAGCYKEEFTPADDFELLLRMAEIGKIANLPEVVLRYRIHPNSLSELNRQKQRDGAQRACESAWRRRGIEGHFEATEPWRAGADKNSRHSFAVDYGWMAWNHGHKGTWWTYAWEALRLRPLALSSWQLLVFGFLKRPHKQAEN